MLFDQVAISYESETITTLSSRCDNHHITSNNKTTVDHALSMMTLTILRYLSERDTMQKLL